MSFKKGDKLLVINMENLSTKYPRGLGFEPKEGDVVTCDGMADGGVMLKEYPFNCEMIPQDFSSHRFKKLDDDFGAKIAEEIEGDFRILEEMERRNKEFKELEKRVKEWDGTF